MTDRVIVNADRSALLPANSPQKGYRITRKEAADLGLLKSAEKPTQERRSTSDDKPTVKRRTTKK